MELRDFGAGSWTGRILRQEGLHQERESLSVRENEQRKGRGTTFSRPTGREEMLVAARATQPGIPAISASETPGPSRTTWGQDPTSRRDPGFYLPTGHQSHPWGHVYNDEPTTDTGPGQLRTEPRPARRHTIRKERWLPPHRGPLPGPARGTVHSQTLGL